MLQRNGTQSSIEEASPLRRTETSTQLIRCPPATNPLASPLMLIK